MGLSENGAPLDLEDDDIGDDIGEDIGSASGGASGGASSELGREVVGMARGGLLNLVGAAFSQMALFGLTILLARRLGKDQAGVYFEAFAFLSILGLLSLSGFRAGLTRFVAVHLADRDRKAMRGTVQLGLGITIPAAVALGAGLFLAAPYLATHLFHDQDTLKPLRYVGVILPAATFTDAALSATQGFRTMKPYALVGLFLEPALRIGLTFALIEGVGRGSSRGVEGAMQALVISNWVAAIASAIWLRKLMGKGVGRAVRKAKELFKFSTVSWMASLASTGLIWADTILLGHYKKAEEVGVYNSATRLVTLATFVMTPITATFAPRIASLYRRGRTKALGEAYGIATSWIVRLSLPAFVVLLIFSKEALVTAFGPKFAVGADVTMILAIGQMVNSATGPCGVMLNMSGRPALSMIDNIGVLILNIGLNLWLIPRYGIRGSAAAWAFSLALVNIIRLVQVRRTMKVYPFDWGTAKGLGAALIAGGAGVGMQAAFDGTAALLAGSATILVVYVLFVRVAGLTESDRLVLQGLLRRGRGGKGRGPEPAFEGI